MLIKTADTMPLSNFAKIYNNADLNYMFTNPTEKHEITSEVIESYYNLLHECGFDSKLIVSFFIFASYLQIVKNNKILNEYADLAGKEKVNNSYQKVANSWANYLNVIESQNSVYEFDEFYFEDVPECFELVKNAVFYHISEYRMFVKDLPGRNIYLNELFLNKHLKTRKVKVNAKILAKHIQDSFLKINLFEGSFDALIEIFHINNLQPVATEKKQTFELELQIIQKITGNALPLATAMLSEYIAAKELSKLINEQNKK
jgi:hypothetical protein